MTRLLVLRLSALGDVIHTIPAVAALRETHEVSWVVEAPYRELVEVVAGVEAIPTRMKKWGKSLLASRAEMGATLRAMSKADEAIDFQGLVKSAMLPWLARVRTRRGFDRNAIREKPALLFTNRKTGVDTSKHVIEQNLELAGVSAGRANWDAYPQNNGLDAFANKIVLLPGAGKVNKLWPVDRFRELARRIGGDAVAVWGPGERELAEAIGARVAPPTTLRELAFILQNARVVIGGDTGPLHLAVALGTKVIGLYGPTNPRRNGPYGQLDHCVDHFPTTKWMESISVEEVMTILQRISA
ncbi:MAG TPA: glycosyltransferase family 9 protein [Thermoanaerobaculia bacterium]|jgi:heptosyltransferase-1